MFLVKKTIKFEVLTTTKDIGGREIKLKKECKITELIDTHAKNTSYNSYREIMLRHGYYRIVEGRYIETLPICTNTVEIFREVVSLSNSFIIEKLHKYFDEIQDTNSISRYRINESQSYMDNIVNTFNMAHKRSIRITKEFDEEPIELQNLLKAIVGVFNTKKRGVKRKNIKGYRLKPENSFIPYKIEEQFKLDPNYVQPANLEEYIGVCCE